MLHSQPTAVFEAHREPTEQMAAGANRRYAEIMRDVEELINDHSMSQHPRRDFYYFDASLPYDYWTANSRSCTSKRGDS